MTEVRRDSEGRYHLYLDEDDGYRIIYLRDKDLEHLERSIQEAKGGSKPHRPDLWE